MTSVDSRYGGNQTDFMADANSLTVRVRDVSEKHFCDYGFNKTSMREIASASRLETVRQSQCPGETNFRLEAQVHRDDPDLHHSIGDAGAPIWSRLYSSAFRKVSKSARD